MNRRYLVEADGTAVVVIPASVAARLNRSLADHLRRAVHDGVRLHSDLVSVAWAIDGAASIHRASAARHAAAAPPGTASPCSQGERITTAEAAERIGCTERNVRALAERGTLPGERTARGWELDPAGVDAYSRHRAEQRTNQEEMS